MKMEKEKFEKMDSRVVVQTLDRLLRTLALIHNGALPASEEMKTATRNSIKELCAAVGEWVDYL